MIFYELDGIDAKKFKRAVRVKMAQGDLTVSELADLIGYSRQSVYNFLSGDNWNRFMAAALAEKLNISKEDIQ